MAQIAKLEVQTEIQSSSDKFYDIFKSKGYLMPKICPDYIKSVQLIKGDWQTVGSIKLWTYCAGNCETVKEMVEAIDEESKSITFDVLEGPILTHYTTYKSTLQVATRDQSRMAIWTVEYHKKDDDNIPHPNNYLGFLDCISKSVDAYLLKM